MTINYCKFSLKLQSQTNTHKKNCWLDLLFWCVRYLFISTDCCHHFRRQEIMVSNSHSRDSMLLACFSCPRPILAEKKVKKYLRRYISATEFSFHLFLLIFTLVSWLILKILSCIIPEAYWCLSNLFHNVQ